MKKFFHSLTKTGRREKRAAKEKDFRNRLRFDHYEALYRQSALHSTEPGIGNERPETITVTLTSYGARIETAYLAVESLMQQSLRPDRIVLCLARDEFNNAQIPATLRRQRERGLEIRFCEEDLGPHTKYYYTMRNYPEDLIVTVDDDLIYPIDTLDSLYRAFIREPQVIHCNRGHRMRFAPDGRPLPYKQWLWNHTAAEASPDLFPTGVGGVLYFPGSLSPEVLNKETFMRLAPKTDDVWLKVMSLRNGTPCKQTRKLHNFSDRSTEIPGTQQIGLKLNNKNENYGNDHCINRVFNEFKLNPNTPIKNV